MDLDMEIRLCFAIGALERFGFDNATLADSEDAWIDLWTSNRFLTLRFRNYRGEFIAQGLFKVKPLPEQSISHFVPIVADPAVVARRGFGPALIGLQQTVAYVEAWSIAISESIPDILGGDYRRVKELQAAHYRRVQQFADEIGSGSNISSELWGKVIEYEASEGRSGP